MLKLITMLFSLAVMFTSVGSASSLENNLSGNQIAEGKLFTVKTSTDKNDINGEKTKMKNRETAVLGAGCFWCVEAIFQKLKGVISVEPGYTGGTVANPTYEEVCSGKTGHAEVAKIVFDSTKISYGEILDVFFEIHDPTTLNRQGNDIGEQYRSVIFYADEQQRKIAEETVKRLEAEKVYDSPIVTEIVPLETFYPAENYHKNYYENNKDKPYCRFVISPKVKKFEKKFSGKLKKNMQKIRE